VDYPDLLIMAFLFIAALALCSIMLLVEAQQSKVSSAFHMQSLLLNSLGVLAFFGTLRIP